MLAKIDLGGKRFGRLVALEYLGKGNWRCRCDCGNECTVYTTNLRRGHTRSCGCLLTEFNCARNYTHQATGTPLWNRWRGMFIRCSSKNKRMKPYYADKGITICAEWQVFENFQNWALSNGWSEDLTLDRINNNEGYSPSNCRWITMTDQANNKSNNHWITWDGITKTLSQWAKETGIHRRTLSSRVEAGLSGQGLFAPVRSH